MYKVVKKIIMSIILLLVYIIGVAVGIMYEKDYCDTGTMCIRKVNKDDR